MNGHVHNKNNMIHNMHMFNIEEHDNETTNNFAHVDLKPKVSSKDNLNSIRSKAASSKHPQLNALQRQQSFKGNIKNRVETGNSSDRRSSANVGA